MSLRSVHTDSAPLHTALVAVHPDSALVHTDFAPVSSITRSAALDESMANQATSVANADPAEQAVGVQQTSCCVVGGGRGGMVLALLLARRGVPVPLLEAHADFDRQFRGDTVHPAILEVLDQLGLAERLHRLPHVKFFG